MAQETMNHHLASKTQVIGTGSISVRVVNGSSTSGRNGFNPSPGMTLNFVAP